MSICSILIEPNVSLLRAHTYSESKSKPVTAAQSSDSSVFVQSLP
eukprot:CAMPEP_0196154618 /NCGR_PEP_ID=MMETSP0910-20130528/39229_1 /TAXON_ID=49265 /ORGANISM="Thalassiosira rotula, Strain GSO102" /LENGTH=44 /DNA_ID= /DNA_START= /DNA_END= /DNA_ORIENTATION=